MKNMWVLADYYPQFSCKIAQCRRTCCGGWKIPISRKEYFKLITDTYSSELDQKIQNAFIEGKVSDENAFRYIGFNYLGYCPMLKDGYCDLHKQKGSDKIPKVCQLYPRSLKRINDVYIGSCSNACEMVVELIFKNKGLKLIKKELDIDPQLDYQLADEDIGKIKKMQRIMDSNEEINNKVADICMVLNADAFRKDQERSGDPLTTMITLLKQLQAQDEVLGEMIRQLSETEFDYDQEKERFAETFTDWQSVYSGVLHNSLIYENYLVLNNPRVYKGFCAAYGMMRVLGAAYTHKHNKKKDLVDVISAIFHLVDHTSFYDQIGMLEINTAGLIRL